MKKILIRHYDQEWNESDLNYEDEIQRIKNDDMYLQMRNSTGSVNSYAIVNIEESSEDNTKIISTKFRYYDGWDHQLARMGKFFINHFAAKPNILLANSRTFEKIDEVIGKAGYMDQFQHPDFNLRLCINDDIPEDEYHLICDEEAEFEDIIEHETLVRFGRVLNSLKNLDEEWTNDMRKFISGLNAAEKKHLKGLIQENMKSGELLPSKRLEKLCQRLED